MIKFLLNHLPRPLLQRAAGLAMPLARWWYAVGRGRKGDPRKGVECPLCGGRFRRFMPYGYVETRRNALCPGCMSLERHRLLWLWLRSAGLLDGTQKILHIAPEACLSRNLEKLLPPENYITADLESPLAKVKMDVQAIPFPDATFDIIFCNHVLEHVADDGLAMRQLLRVTKPGGRGVLLSPVDGTRVETFEDDTITDPGERTRLFGQYDHRRVYGRDYPERLARAGWLVTPIDFYDTLPPEKRKLFALRREILYIVQRQI